MFISCDNHTRVHTIPLHNMMSFRVAFVIVAVLAMFGAVLAFSGRGTWFNVGLGACGGYNNNNQLVAALVREIATNYIKLFIIYLILNLFWANGDGGIVEEFQICVNILKFLRLTLHPQRTRRSTTTESTATRWPTSGDPTVRCKSRSWYAPFASALSRHRVLIAVSTPSYLHRTSARAVPTARST
jgi:hypothetical protein